MEVKLNAVEAERDAMLSLEHMPSEPLPDFTATVSDMVPLMVVEAGQPVPPAPRRRVFATDQDLAAWAI